MEDPQADECFERIRSWYTGCERDRERCRHTLSDLPGEARAQRLIHIDVTSTPTLLSPVNTNDGARPCQYVAFTHCWGRL